MNATLQKISDELPEDFDQLEPVHQLDELMRVANHTLQPEGNWILVNGDLTVGDFLGAGLQNLTLYQLLENQERVQVDKGNQESNST